MLTAVIFMFLAGSLQILNRRFFGFENMDTAVIITFILVFIVSFAGFLKSAKKILGSRDDAASKN